MNYLGQFGIILSITYLGELIHKLVPLPVPASIYGLVLMLLFLQSGLIRPEQVAGAGSFLLACMPVMFIPAAAGLVTIWGELQSIWLPVLVIMVATTVIVMGITGRVTQFLIRKGKKS